MWSLDQEESGAGGAGGERCWRGAEAGEISPRRSPRPRQEQSSRSGPRDGITLSWKHVLPRAQALHDLTTTCFRQGRKRGNLSYF